MALSLHILDIRGKSTQQAISELKEILQTLKAKGSLWLVNDCEPIECYEYMIQKEIYFETFITSPNEYRIFISHY